MDTGSSRLRKRRGSCDSDPDQPAHPAQPIHTSAQGSSESSVAHTDGNSDDLSSTSRAAPRYRSPVRRRYVSVFSAFARSSPTRTSPTRTSPTRTHSLHRRLLGIGGSRSHAEASETNLAYPTQRRLFFVVGIFFGLALTTFLGVRYTPIEFALPERAQNTTGLGDYLLTILGDVDISNLLVNSSARMNPAEVLGNLTEAIVSFSLFSSVVPENEEFMPGLKLADQGLHAKHPVVLVPGIVSTGLEAWNPPPASYDQADAGHHHQHHNNSNGNGNGNSNGSHNREIPCGQKYFRKRLWGTMNQFQALLLDKDCWISHMKLDEKTGMDPPGFRLRAAQGLDAADYLFPGYWVFARIIANLAALGYDNNQMILASYDWRLGFADLEKRDHYFTYLKSSIELLVKTNPHGEKAVVVSHSMGSLVLFYFLHWVQSPAGGNGGDTWLQDNIHSWVNLAGPMLGVPKAVSSLISGEMRDTVQLNFVGASIAERLFSKRDRAALFRTWTGLPSMLPKGGEIIWGHSGEPAPDEPQSSPVPASEPLSGPTSSNGIPTNSFSTMVDYTSPQNISNQTITEAIDLVVSLAADAITDRWFKTYNNLSRVASSREDLLAAHDDPSFWTNPLLTPLPNLGDNFKLYCMYGVGLASERKYFYKREKLADVMDPETLAKCRSEYSVDCDWAHSIDVTINSKERSVENGVQLSDGDSTVPLISLGYMCAEGWRRRRYNPFGAKIVTREHLDRTDTGVTSFRGGPNCSSHTELLGNHAVIEDLLLIVSGHDTEDKLSDQFISEIREISRRVRLPDGLDD
ncbi:Lecithin:cholesterol acyltransferase-domain-containing protein [Polychytrium aggregatum]|uniref:Lecithin:cholesterol acyltransferase-domain-containing protein n=1 Tax=Polychytrium aggregatum TaxID=110093 RepID=UPI0022FE3DA7|nr:Lecithin:cholesterol acyltransferase-domain-containing protein [Polychytrium aggregatum]KAI9202233.1 Lecithin:cholesterol acyltransferase-domain-containing protein [Polychytrium aggregatum]